MDFPAFLKVRETMTLSWEAMEIPCVPDAWLVIVRPPFVKTTLETS